MPRSKFWEESLRKFGFGKNNVATTNRLRTLCDDSFNNVQEMRAILLAFAGDDIPCSAFFDKEGKPLSFADICQQAQGQVKRLQVESKENRGFLRFFLVTLNKWSNLLMIPVFTALALSSSNKVEAEAHATQALTFGAGLLAYAWMDDHFSGKLRNAVNKKMKDDIKTWSTKVLTTNKIMQESIHQDIRDGCSDGKDSSIRDVRLFIMRHHPTMNARVLIHPDGRLLYESEICKALAYYGT